MPDSEVIDMVCGNCGNTFNVLREWAGIVKCPNCDQDLKKKEQPTPQGVGAGDFASVAGLIGQSLGGCRVDEIIGRGSMGIVFKATHMGLRREVAMKILPVTKSNKPILKRLIFEARTIARLDHPNIVQVYDIGIQEQFVFIIMQLLRGKTLSTYARELGRVPTEEAIRICKQVAGGLAEAHSKGVIHRDLKPENIMLTQDLNVKIMDFGLAKETGEVDEMGQYIVGTPLFMAPEQWLGKNVDERVDVYALGIIMYIMLAGKKPFEAKSISDLMKMHLKSYPASPKQFNPPLSDALCAIARKMIAKEPERRYKTAAEFLQDLTRYQNGQDPKAMAEYGTFVKCGFCETLNPATMVKCKVCNEPLRTSKASSLLLDDEHKCSNCGGTFRTGSRACPGCRKQICIRCKARIAVLSGYCQYCASQTKHGQR